MTTTAEKQAEDDVTFSNDCLPVTWSSLTDMGTVVSNLAPHGPALNNEISHSFPKNDQIRN